MGYGGTCDMKEDFPWCYVKEKAQCNDGIEECEGGVCEFWSEKACKPGGTSGGAATVAAQHSAMIKANPTAHAGAVTPGCKCKPGNAEAPTHGVTWRVRLPVTMGSRNVRVGCASGG